MKIKWWWYIVPFLALQVPFAFSPMCVWDSAVQQHLYNSNNFDCAKKLFYDSGVPLSYYEMLPIAGLSHFLLYFKLFSITLFCMGSLATARLLEKLKIFQPFEIYCIAVLTFFYPSYALWQHFIMFPYYISLLAFTLATVSFLNFNETRRVSGSVITLALLLIAFNIQSFLVYHYALLAVFFFFGYATEEKIFARILSFLRYHGVFILFPLLYYFTINHFFPKAGFYKEDGYNTITTDVPLVVKELAKSLVNVSITPLYDAIKYLKSDLISSLIYLGIAVLISLILIKKIKAVSDGNFSMKLFLIAFVLAIFTLLPYALVGKHVSTHGYESRHSLLAHTSLLICFIILFRLLGAAKQYFVFLLIVFCFFMFLKQQVHWENRYNKYEAIEKQVEGKEDSLGNIVFITEKNHFWEMDEYLRFYECNMILEDAFHNQNHLGINDEREAHTPTLAQKYLDKYLKYKDCLFFSTFHEGMKITEIEIEEKKEDDAILFLNALMVADKRAYYGNYISVNLK